MTDWSFTVSGPWMLLGIAAWVTAAVFGFIHWRRRPGHGPTLWLESLRLIIITLLLITLMRPERVQRIERTEVPEIVVLADASASMETRDLQQGTNVLTRRDYAELLNAAHPLELGEARKGNFRRARNELQEGRPLVERQGRQNVPEPFDFFVGRLPAHVLRVLFQVEHVNVW